MSAGTNSDPIAIPPIPQGIPVAVTFVTASGEGNIQFTTTTGLPLTDPGIVWQDWELGSCTETMTDVLAASVTGLRLVRTSGTVGIEIVI